VHDFVRRGHVFIGCRGLLVFALAAGGAHPARAADPEPVAEMAPFPYSGQGPFVTGPARVISSPVFGLGFAAGALLCAPVSIAQDPRMEGRVPREKHASLVCGRYLGTAVGWPVYAAVGLPFFIVKGLFWDAPRALFGRGRAAVPS